MCQPVYYRIIKKNNTADTLRQHHLAHPPPSNRSITSGHLHFFVFFVCLFFSENSDRCFLTLMCDLTHYSDHDIFLITPIKVHHNSFLKQEIDVFPHPTHNPELSPLDLSFKPVICSPLVLPPSPPPSLLL